MVSSNNGHFTLVAVFGDGAEVLFLADAELRVLGIRGTFCRSGYGQGFQQLCDVEEVGFRAVVDGCAASPNRAR